MVKILLDKGASLTDKVGEVKDNTIEDGGITVDFWIIRERSKESFGTLQLKTGRIS